MPQKTSGFITRSALVVPRISAIFLLVSSVSIMLFGIGVPPIWQGVIGIIASFEGLNGAETMNLFRLYIFVVGIIIYGVLSFSFGLSAYYGNVFSIDCKVPAVLSDADKSILGNFQTCQDSIRLYALVQLLAGTALSIVLLLLVVPALRQAKKGLDQLEEEKLLEDKVKLQ